MAIWLLRVGLAMVFLYAGVGSIVNPSNWIGYFPIFLRNLVPQNLLLLGFSGYEIVLAVWILSGWKQMFSAGIAAMTLLGIVVFNFGAMDIVFRDLGLFFMALALVLQSR